MSVGIRLASLLLGILTVIVSGIVFLETLDLRWVTGWFNQIRIQPAYQLFVWCTGGALLLFGLGILLRSLTGRGPEPALLLVRGNGRIAISEKAIQSQIMKTVLLAEGIHSPTVRTNISNKFAFIEVEVAFSTFQQVNLPELCRKMQSEITNTVENFTNTPLKKVWITVHDLKSRDTVKVV